MARRDVAGALGRGMVAGLVGTAAMTASQWVESRARGREPSTTPADAAGKVLGVEPVGESGRSRFAQLTHWGYGTTWGAVRGLLGATGMPAAAATGTQLVALQGTAMVMLPALDAAPPVEEWGAAEIAVEVAHHVVYVLTVAVVYEGLQRRSHG